MARGDWREAGSTMKSVVEVVYDGDAKWYQINDGYVDAVAA